MTKDEALEEVRVTVSKFSDFLNERDPEHAINVIEPIKAGFTLFTLDNACKEALSWIDEQTKVEREKEKSPVPARNY